MSSSISSSDDTETTTSPQAAIDSWLLRTNFKAVLEWLTAESILHRPDDPLSFCKDLLEQKLAERRRPNDAFQPELLTKYLRDCYANAVDCANDEGHIEG
mmetsp:Transcript_5627/g.7046  ORF Transcript_5627/g.7046 Transcript_5627/m.7046 type:complete len:100 (-) Transcript_5627:254-553(-)|eukprot:CAMPEP_0172489920 /NCGR_PEP_ID=MMETSP1066-20121228/20189_1 /TAXON_ID=671091 /ORGANISM="Coscinodiscus wailesii, Strain CCMP2513" /LENGTH=99 /DNA_ID=CAMNT_0013258119 /DNA_START=397 /DNA_END=696 /DNA_ORIENTATION=+